MSSDTTVWSETIDLAPKGDIRRVGIIPYAIIGRHIVICLGQDRKHKEFTDFGGGYSVRRDIHPAHCATRELSEESLGVFQLRVDEILHDNCIVSEGNVIIFHRIDYELILPSLTTFQENLKQHQIDEVEVDAIQWIKLSELHSYISTGRVYDKVGNILLSCMNDIAAKLKSTR